jgi:protocatechuate 3,4-dioxygenase beta subunit
VQVWQAYKEGEYPADSEDDVVADEYEEVTMHEMQPQRAPFRNTW